MSAARAWLAAHRESNGEQSRIFGEGIQSSSEWAVFPYRADLDGDLSGFVLKWPKGDDGAPR